jgi:hypothetical protein
MPAPPAVLCQCDEPVTFDCLGIAEQRVVGRPDPLDDPDAAQNRLPAAFWVKWPSGPISK